jgi:photosystem II stability/assembly factor-like uncharacterized protein
MRRLTTLASLTGLLAVGISIPQVTTVSGGTARAASERVRFFGQGTISPSPEHPLFDLVCPTTTVCYGYDYGPNKYGEEGWAILATADGGRTWVDRTPHILHDTYNLSCPGTLTCYAVNQVDGDRPAFTIARTMNGGRSWWRQTKPSQGYIGALTCPTVRTCYASGGGPGGTFAMMTLNGGRVWQKRSRPFVLAAITCLDPATCYGIGGPIGQAVTMETTDGGRSWQTQSTQDGRDFLPGGLACPARQLCYVIAMTRAESRKAGASLDTPFTAQLYASTDGGKTWEQRYQAKGLSAVACTSARSCVAVAGFSPGPPLPGGSASASSFGQIVRTTDAGQTWVTTYRTVRRALLTVSCPGNGICLASGDTTVRTTNGGQRWTHP